jgi:hypothetical protein
MHIVLNLSYLHNRIWLSSRESAPGRKDWATFVDVPAARDVENLLVDEARNVQHLRPVAMAELGWQERRDLQRWLQAHPDVLGRGLLLITEEFADWEGAAGPVADRLDLLFLDQDGRLVVVELKRGMAPDRTESQALVYAAYCDQLTTSDIAAQFARFHEVSVEEAREKILDHAPVLGEEQPGKVRVRIVAEDFPASVTSTVLFLRELGSGGPESAKLDIGCTKLTAYALPDGSHVMSVQPLIPIPETEDYLVRRRVRAAVDESARETRTRAANATILLLRAKAIEPGTRLRLNLGWFSPRERATLQELLSTEPQWGEVTWTGEENQARTVQVEWSDEPVSVNAHHQEMRSAAGLGGQPGATHAWLVGDTGKSLRDLADELEAS